ncbi:MFS transporter [uncultured Desulfovibrio sp.]|uniref:MFS transporter n=1 Tax=uncultured Desulfovibrio sp. TaxID=167968 RepID=UPI0028047CE4|nr:MFS transporter [uncultured Desulfovibrio sp.]
MKSVSFAEARRACAYFFLCPGLAYGIFTSRLPALKAQTGANDAEVGLILLALGLGSVCGLLTCGKAIRRSSSRTVLRVGSGLTILGLAACGLAPRPLVLGGICAFTGLGIGLSDVAQNTQGIMLESAYRKNCMSFMHAAYGLGGLAGALSGALCAWLGFGPSVNAACVLGLYSLGRPWAVPRLLPDTAPQGSGATAERGRVPLFILCCGLLALLAFVIEGSVAEWGSLLLATAKRAPDSVAALAFAVFSLSQVGGRWFGDRLRDSVGDFLLCLVGGLTCACAMLLVLVSASPAVCLTGYAIMGLAISPVVPILFSRAGQYPGVSPVRASETVSIMSYSGLLFFPPLLGFGAQHYGLERTLMVISVLCLVVAAGAFPLRKNGERRPVGSRRGT